MLDIKLLREEPDRLRDNLRDRNARVFDDSSPSEGDDWAARTVERLGRLDQRYRDLLHEQEQLRQRQNANSLAMREVGKRPKDEQAAARAPLVEEGRALRERERELNDEAQAALVARDEAWRRVPNLTHPESPRGNTDDDHRELRRVGTPRDFAAEGFSPRDHLEVAESLQLCDFAAGAKVAGQKFYYLTREAVLLDLALQRYALDVALRHGFTLHTTPDLARVEILEGLGFNPRGASTQVYSVADTDLCLVGTAEITLGGMLADTIMEPESLPLLLCGLSHCFRTEAGAAGQESRGLYRVHQFTKVELFAFTAGELSVSEAMHQRLLDIEEEIFGGLELPYRVLDIASGDLGGPALRKFDIEAWMPGRGAYGEVTSTSNCTDYQARRLKIRHRVGEGDPASNPTSNKKAKNRFVHMLNGTAVATSRAIVAILENHQQADGSVTMPKVLQPYLGFDRIGPR
ncbi:serine--tRNA ligase [Paraliomyxa miuraensis]|uniref:serine--tRNA ligase n=1 Tax=Paraliomyxa miuraensis TaxID=376150 RepID=UPI00225583AE|nr:serine--tRNA ligase [Paraliomyxa miuraensis]MCX4240809.1 serine--tRNA ligase [Paraliomyxa miuraensis]